MMRPLMLTLFILSCLLSFVSSQACYDACELPISTCTYVTYPVYPINLNTNNTESRAHEIISFAEGAAFIIGNECLEQVKKYTCGYLYPSCINGTSPGSPPTLVKPCLQMCLDVNKACKEYISSLPTDYQHLLNCSQTNPDDSLHFSNNRSSCSSVTSLTPIDRCTNNSGPGYQPSGCQVYNRSQSPLTSETCSPFVSNEIYSLLPQSTLDVIANSTVSLISKLYAVIPLGCYKGLLSLLCQTAYPTCKRMNDSSGQLVQHGISPCYEFCTQVFEECLVFFEYVGGSFLNCSMTGQDGKPLWPRGEESLTPCSTSLFPPNASRLLSLPPVDKCPSILGKRPNPSDKEQHCWIPCPDPTYSPAMWRHLNIICLVCGGISFATMTFMIVSTLLNAKKRGRHIQLCVYFSCLLQGLSFLINGLHPEESVWCDDPVTYATASSNSSCGVQGFFFQFSTLSVGAWWLVIAYHMFCTVVLHEKSKLRDRTAYYSIFGWGIPLLLTIVTIATGNLSFGPPAPWCYIHDKGVQYNYGAVAHNTAGIAYDFYVFYIPVGSALFIAGTLFSCVFYRIILTLRGAKSVRAITKADLGVKRRVLFFLLFLFVQFILMFEWRISLVLSDTSKGKHQNFLYVLCQIKNDLAIGYDPSCKDPELPFRVNFAHTSFETFLASSGGFFVFLAFGSEKSLYTWWITLFSLRSLKEIKEFITTGPIRTSFSPTLNNKYKNTPSSPSSRHTSPHSSYHKDNLQQTEEDSSFASPFTSPPTSPPLGFPPSPPASPPTSPPLGSPPSPPSSPPLSSAPSSDVQPIVSQADQHNIPPLSSSPNLPKQQTTETEI